MKMSQIVDEACREAAIYREAGIVSVSETREGVCSQTNFPVSVFSGWCHHREHA